jgi:hypothetical protein
MYRHVQMAERTGPPQRLLTKEYKSAVEMRAPLATAACQAGAPRNALSACSLNQPQHHGARFDNENLWFLRTAITVSAALLYSTTSLSKRGGFRQAAVLLHPGPYVGTVGTGVVLTQSSFVCC